MTATDESRRSLVPLVRVVGHKRFVMLIRYPINTATQFLSMFIFFALVFFGGKAVAGPGITDSLDGIVVGFFVWTLATVGFRGLADDVQNEARWGTLERLFLSPYGFGTVMTAKTLVNVCYTLVWSSALLLLLMASTDRWLHVDPLTVIPLALFTIASFIGVGFFFAGLAVHYKRIENVFSLVVFGFVALIAAPVGQYPALTVLPGTQGSYLMRLAMEDGLALWEFAPTALAALVATAVGYWLVGYYCFTRAQRRARKLGSLGEY